MNTAPFYIGQKVVALKSSTTCTSVKKGNVYTVLSLEKCHNCGLWMVGILPYEKRTLFNKCADCNCAIPVSHYWCGRAKYFAPVHEGFESISFTKVLEEELVSVN